uniref:Ubiquitin-like protease family profile domain-containing protein n=1 Tax=Globisporangium ultimum (strain ATCC 200006 / CBS 805.95 / DAOM BR144) TaxID=431595 RepID=K3WMB9_GLOUD
MNACEIEAQFDAFRYAQRIQDATIHSQNVAREYPVSMMKPTVNRNDGRTHFHPYRESTRDNSRESFLRKLQQLDSEEYGELPVYHDGQQQQKPATDWAPEDPLDALRKKNNALRQRLSKTLSQKAERRAKGDNAGVRASLERFSKSFKRDERKTEPYGHKEQYKQKHKDEIEELEVQLREQRLGAADDDFFYKNISQREANVLINEVCHELLLEAAIETFEAAERAAKKKELPPEQLKIVQDALRNGPADRVLIQKFNVDITRRHLQCLHPLQWLNDEVINFYMQLLMERDERLVKDGTLEKRSHFFNSFFYTKVSEGGYNFVNVRRWTRKIDLFAMDKIFVPVNISNTHWCMAVIFMSEKRIQYYDSMNGSGSTCLNVLMKYLHDEMENKKHQKFSDEGWKLVPTDLDSTPQQQNGSDCGVFSCMFADFLSQNKPLSFSQKDMEFHRSRMVLRIVEGTVPPDDDL